MVRVTNGLGLGVGGLAKFDGVRWNVYNTSNSKLPSDFVTTIAIDEQGNKWIGTVPDFNIGGIAKFDGVSWSVYNTSNSGLPENSVWAIAIDEQGTNGLELLEGLPSIVKAVLFYQLKKKK
jgi:hypothetical protein